MAARTGNLPETSPDFIIALLPITTPLHKVAENYHAWPLPIPPSLLEKRGASPFSNKPSPLPQVSTSMIRERIRRCPTAALVLSLLGSYAATAVAANPELWDLARERQAIHRFSTLFTAHNVRDHLSSDKGIDDAIAWCKETGVTKVYLETYRSNYTARADALSHARDRFRDALFEVSGCVTTTNIGKRSTGWNLISCYTDSPTQMTLQKIFEYTASIFDETMIDDFWFTDCKCDECDKARKAKIVTIGDETFPVMGDSWEDYRCELMVQLSRIRILQAAKRVNPKATLINKYPQWYDEFHNRGYEVVRETEDFDRIWVGTETRDYEDQQWGGTPQYEAYFIMRWLGGIGGEKCGGGWYDPYGTTEATYLEQARQTVLGGARESMLFCYGSLLENTGPKNIEALRENVPALLDVAQQVARRTIVGVAAYKPPNSHPENEPRVFDFVGMLGLPLVPCDEFPVDADAAFFSLHALKDPACAGKLAALIATGKPVLITDGLADRLKGKIELSAANVQILPVHGQPKSLLELPQEQLDSIRQPLLKASGHHFHAPNKVALYIFSDGSWVVENFNDNAVVVQLDGEELQIEARGWKLGWK